VQNEFIEEVFLEMKIEADQDWRKESGLLLSGKKVVFPESSNRIWDENVGGHFKMYRVVGTSKCTTPTVDNILFFC
jgi:hypothetical protein